MDRTTGGRWQWIGHLWVQWRVVVMDRTTGWKMAMDRTFCRLNGGWW